MHDVAQGGGLWGLGLWKEVELNRLSETPTVFFHGTGPSWPCLGAWPCDWLWTRDVCGTGACRGLTVGLPSCTPSAITSRKELPAGGLSRRNSAVGSPGPGLPLPPGLSSAGAQPRPPSPTLRRRTLTLTLTLSPWVSGGGFSASVTRSRQTQGGEGPLFTLAPNILSRFDAV